jgi:hypothetical protein
MKRVALTDGSVKWFDEEKATAFKEETFWDGNNHISKITGSQWDHEILYRTASGKWVTHEWSQVQGSEETYTSITDEEAAKWFIQNEYQDTEIPPDILGLISDHLSALEL